MSRSSDRWFPPTSKPRPVEGGIKAQSKRGAIGQTWWSERFIEVLNDIGVGTRLQRGRTYARKGQVIEMDVTPGVVTALVQGSRVRPYRVRIGLTAFGKAEWLTVCQKLADSAWYAARLLSGEMPDDIEDVFDAVGLSLFPQRADEISMDCSCPDWSVPCKHLAAVFYLLAESFDADPFGVLAWRGRDRDDLLDILGSLRSGRQAGERHQATDAAVPLSDCLDSFFVAPTQPHRQVPVLAAADAIMDQVPDTGVTIRGVALQEVLRPAYRLLDWDEAS